MAGAYSRAIKYLAIRDRTVKETTDYLLRKGYSTQETQEAIDRLVEVDLLNDRRTAQHWVDYWLACKPRGRKRMDMDLRRHGVDREIIEEVLTAVDDEMELELALRLLTGRQVQDWPRQKLYRFLQYRGFSYLVIEKVNAHAENLTHG